MSLSGLLDKTCGERRWKKIGEGGFGKIFLCKPKNKPQFVLKVSPLKNAQQLEDAKMECRLPEQIRRSCKEEHLRCPVLEHVCAPVWYDVNRRPYFVIKMPFANYGSAEKLVESGGIHEPITNILDSFIGLANDLYVLHTQLHRLHRDIKPDNILVMKEDQRYSLYLADYGLSCVIGSCFPGSGTLHYMDPWALLDKDDSEAWNNPDIDIYALGVTWYEILAGQYYIEPDSRLSELIDLQYSQPSRQIENEFIQAMERNYREKTRQFKSNMYRRYKNSYANQGSPFAKMIQLVIDMMNPFQPELRPDIEELMEL